MRKRLSLLLLILSLTMTVTSCGGVSAGGSSSAKKGASYTKMKEIESLEDFNGSAMLGISPDGKNIIVSADESISVIDLDNLKVKESMDSDEARLGAKTALWAQKGDSFLLGDAAYVGNELKIMKSFNLSTYTLNDSDQVTDENTEESFMKGGVLLYSPTWSADGKSVIYSSASDEGIKIVKVNVKSGEESVLYQTEDKSGFEQGLELKNGLLLCEFNGARIGDNDLFLYDTKKEDKEPLKKIIDKDETLPGFYEIKGWSEDRRTVLINKLVYGRCIQKSFILTFNQGFDDYKMKKLEYQVFDQLGALINHDDKKENHIAYANILSSDGRYLISREDEVLEVKDSAIVKSSRQLVLHDLVEDEDHVLYETEEQELFGILSPLNKNCAPLFLTDNGILMVWFDKGYKLFQLGE